MITIRQRTTKWYFYGWMSSIPIWTELREDAKEYESEAAAEDDLAALTDSGEGVFIG